MIEEVWIVGRCEAVVDSFDVEVGEGLGDEVRASFLAGVGGEMCACGSDAGVDVGEERWREVLLAGDHAEADERAVCEVAAGEDGVDEGVGGGEGEVAEDADDVLDCDAEVALGLVFGG